MTVRHIADPARGAQEAAINAGLARDGIGQRICLHPDRTVSWDAERRVQIIECDYCPATVTAAESVIPGQLPAGYWRVEE